MPCVAPSWELRGRGLKEGGEVIKKRSGLISVFLLKEAHLNHFREIRKARRQNIATPLTFLVG